MAFHAEAMSEQKRNPISTLDDAVMWLAEVAGKVEFYPTTQTTLASVAVDHPSGEWASRLIGDGGFDARGTLMMATRELWEMVNK